LKKKGKRFLGNGGMEFYKKNPKKSEKALTRQGGEGILEVIKNFFQEE
jgi:hypothetical protein